MSPGRVETLTKDLRNLMKPFAHNRQKLCIDFLPTSPARSWIYLETPKIKIKKSHIESQKLQILCVFHLYMCARKCWSSKSFLCFISGLPPWHAKNKSSLIPSCCCSCYTISIIPPSMDSFTRIQEVQFNNLELKYNNTLLYTLLLWYALG